MCDDDWSHRTEAWIADGWDLLWFLILGVGLVLAALKVVFRFF